MTLPAISSPQLTWGWNVRGNHSPHHSPRKDTPAEGGVPAAPVPAADRQGTRTETGPGRVQGMCRWGPGAGWGDHKVQGHRANPGQARA